MSEVICVIQARAGSTRLPGKVLLDFNGRPMLRHQIDRLASFSLGPVVVATSDLARDDPVADVAAGAGAEVVRGSETDVLRRFVQALDAHPAAHVVRLTGDCPLTDPVLVEAVVARHLATGADYTSNLLPRTFPKGLDVEVVTAEALRRADALATSALEREHVTPFLYRHPERHRLATLWGHRRLGAERWVVDVPDDIERLRAAVAARPGFVGWEELVGLVHPAGTARRTVLVPTTSEASEVAASALGRPWAVDYAVVRDGAQVGGVMIGFESAAATVVVEADAPADEVRDAVHDELLAQPQSDSVEIGGEWGRGVERLR